METIRYHVQVTDVLPDRSRAVVAKAFTDFDQAHGFAERACARALRRFGGQLVNGHLAVRGGDAGTYRLAVISAISKRMRS